MTRKYTMFYWGDEGPPKSMPKHETRELISVLKEIRHSAKMTNADFSDELKEKTDLYRKLHIVEPLTRLIDRYEKHLNQ